MLQRLRRNPTEGALGINPPASAKACVRNHHLVSQLSADLSEYWWRIAQYNADSTGSDWKRTERRHQEDAALELMQIVRQMSPPIRQVVELRAAGLDWKQIAEALPKRAFFSLKDDWAAALRHLTERHDDVINRAI